MPVAGKTVVMHLTASPHGDDDTRRDGTRSRPGALAGSVRSWVGSIQPFAGADSRLARYAWSPTSTQDEKHERRTRRRLTC